MKDRWLIVENTQIRLTFASDEYLEICEGIRRQFGQYSLMVHQPHTTPGQHHIHVLLKNKKLFAINRDGSAHDQSHGYTLPREAREFLRKEFPGWTIPDILESISNEQMIAEGMDE